MHWGILITTLGSSKSSLPLMEVLSWRFQLFCFCFYIKEYKLQTIPFLLRPIWDILKPSVTKYVHCFIVQLFQYSRQGVIKQTLSEIWYSLHDWSVKQMTLWARICNLIPTSFLSKYFLNDLHVCMYSLIPIYDSYEWEINTKYSNINSLQKACET